MHAALSNQQALALIQEAQSCQNLLRDSVAAIRDLRQPLVHGDAVFTLGSIGVEKTMKMMLGCAEVERGMPWPDKPTLKKWSHDIESLADRLMTTAKASLSQAKANGYAGTLIERIESSTILPLLFATLSRYGLSGRFHYLDILATNQQVAIESPATHWGRLEDHVRTIVPGLTKSPTVDPKAYDAYLARSSAIIANELDIWWFAVHRLGLQGCFGLLGEKIGTVIWDSGRVRPIGID
jgi:hypothetical protein